MHELVPENRPSRWKRLLPGLAIGLVLGSGATWMMRPKQAAHAHDAHTEKKHNYQCPMHPQIIQDHEGTCPICGMDLVVMEAGSASLMSPGPDGLVTVQIDAQRQQLIGLRTAAVEEGNLGGSLRAPGRVVVAEPRLRRVTVKTEGYVEKLHADFTGRPVRKGQPLFELYSPEFLMAEREYSVSLRSLKNQAGTPGESRWKELAETAKRRLEYLDAPASLLKALANGAEPSRCLTVVAPYDGLVTVRNISQGSRIGPADVALELADLSRVWVLADLYEQDLAQVKVGMTATMELPALGQKLSGRVVFLDPLIDPKTRTLKARLEFPNPKGVLRPEMLGEVAFSMGERRALTVPLDSVLDSGTRKIAFVDVGNGHFEPREVKVGRGGGDRIEVLEGLKKGERVVTRAAFLVDSESRLQAALAELNRKNSAPKAPAGH